MFKTYNTLHSCQHFPAGSRQAARCARIYERSLLASMDGFSFYQMALRDSASIYLCQVSKFSALDQMLSRVQLVFSQNTFSTPYILKIIFTIPDDHRCLQFF